MEPENNLEEKPIVEEKPTVEKPVVAEPVMTESVAEEPVTTEPVAPVISSEKPKKNSGMIFGMVLLVLLAAGGIGFGAWAMMDKSAAVEKLNGQIADLKEQIIQLKKQIPVDYDDEEDVEEEIKEEETKKDEAEKEDIASDDKKVVDWPVIGGVFGTTFYVMDNSEKIVAKDGTVYVLDLTSCDIPVGPDMTKVTHMTCSVETADGRGVFFYDGIEYSLEYYTYDEWKEKWQDIVNRHS